VEEIIKGNKMEGMSFLLRYLAAAGATGFAVEYLKKTLMNLFSEVKTEVDMDDVLDGMFRTFGWSTYAASKLSAGKLDEAAMSLAFPPIGALKAAAQGKWAELAQFFPAVGKPAYFWLLGGAEDKAIREARRDKLRHRDDDKSLDELRERDRAAAERRARARERALERLNDK
jgi:hypothetical protein